MGERATNLEAEWQRRLQQAVEEEGELWQPTLSTLHITWASGPAPCETQPETGARVWEESPLGRNDRDPRRRNPRPAPTTSAAGMATTEAATAAQAATDEAAADPAADEAPADTAKAEAAADPATDEAAADPATDEAAADPATDEAAMEHAEVEAWERGPWAWPAPERSTAVKRPALKRQASCPELHAGPKRLGPATAELGTGSHGPLDGDLAGGVAGGGDPRADSD
ncbi:GL22366 [Drosophila persimilis]|uniref:GL22366 n=1 Tax=Drosophila persimilis TaxID=7234 RepID=B4HCM2_DROPE|nr:GL22366 [Drosophila persimilis]